MKKIALLFSILLISGSVIAANVYKSNVVSSDQQQAALTIIQAKHAIIKPKKLRSYELTLQKASPEVIYFSDRPLRVSGHVSLNKYVHEWNSSFKTTPPNAVVEIVDLNSNPNKINISNFPVELTKPHISKQHNGTETLQFNIKPIENTSIAPIKNNDFVAVFVDDVCISCIG